MKATLVFLCILALSCKEEDPIEPEMKECDTIYTEEVYVVCCGMTGPGGALPGSDCSFYNYCVEKVICKKPD